MSKKIFVVTKGEYSDYSICGVYDDEKLANSHAGLYKEYPRGTVETYILNEHSNIADGVKNIYACLIDATGKITSVRGIDYGEGIFNVRANVQSRHGTVGEYRVDVNADSKKKAMKIAKDRWAKFMYEKVS